MNETKKSPWIWISLSFIILLFVSFIIFLDQKIVKNHQQIAEPVKSDPDQIKPVFDFYTVLPERKVEIPVKPSTKPNTVNKKTVPAKAGDKYILQAGSFQKLDDADRHKAELALLGLEASINSVNVKGKVYHRIELGPFNGGSEYSRAQKSLIENDIKYMTRTAK